MSSRLFIGNLSYSATEDDLRAAFSALGFELRTVTIVTDRETGQARGFGFVELESPQKAHEAKEVAQNTMVSGRPIRIDDAHEREQRGNDRGGDRRGGGHQRGGRRDDRRDRDRY